MENRIHQHNLSHGLTDSMIKMAEAVKRKGENSVHPLWDVKLDPISYNNFQKNRYFALAAQDRNKKGYWVITRTGGAFLRNELAIPRWIKTCDNVIIGKSAETIKINEFYRAYPGDYWQQNFGFISMPTNQLGLKL